ncbi:MAG: ABC transporter permease [Synergistetes bacterium]|nr:ABC transporter permease [Synergistota bacterium]MCX8128310.1 ABC transporter permease [Synergistota bacterium]MDW8192629.1 ABC transporter permease [Synergistota bacterium]
MKRSEFKYTLFLIKRNYLIMLGLAIVSMVVFLGLFAPLLATHDPEDMVFSDRLKPPSLKHLLGTDDNGMDIFSRILYGIRFDLTIAFVVIAVVSVFGTLLGVISGYYGGLVDEIIMRIADIFLSFPYILLAMAIAAALGPGLFHSIIAISVTWWPVYARLARGMTLFVKEMNYVEAARALGAGGLYIIFKHILPNILPPILVQATLDMGNVILEAAALSFIGLGAQPPQPELGLMVSIGRGYMRDYPWVSLFPGLAIFLMVLGFNLLGDGLRDLLDPKVRRKLL